MGAAALLARGRSYGWGVEALDPEAGGGCLAVLPRGGGEWGGLGFVGLGGWCGLGGARVGGEHGFDLLLIEVGAVEEEEGGLAGGSGEQGADEGEGFFQGV